MTTRKYILNLISLALIAAPADAQHGSCDYERRNDDRSNECGYNLFHDDYAGPGEHNDSRYLPAFTLDRNLSRSERLSSGRYDFDLDRDDDRRGSWRSELAGPFRTQDFTSERRFRIPFRDYVQPGDRQYGLDDLFDRLQDRGPRDNKDNDRFDLSRRVRPSEDYAPLIPPLPRREGEGAAETLSKRITARYQNPATVRMIRSLSFGQGVRLFREVSAQTDARHLEPSAYDLRVRRALRNLALALENPAATQAMQISPQSFRVDGFRDVLSRTWDSMSVQNRNDAEQVMQTVMQQALQVRGMTPGMVAFEFTNATVDTLDKFSALELLEPNRGPSAALETEMVGIGVEVKPDDSGLLVVRALRGGPAAEAGLKSGDVITAINRRSISGMPMSQSVDLVKGPSGSRIQLRIDRSGRNSRSVTLTRRRFRVWTVNDVRMMSGSDVGYLNLSQFAQTSTREVDQALKQLHRRGMKSLVLDLRGNPGGLLTTCVEITNRFLPCGTIVSTKGRLSGDNMHESATFSRTWDTPLVVIVDGDSASASEIFAAAIQDNKRGVVVGENSYGKGTVQTHFPLQSVNGNLRLTTARFYAPSGRAMSGSGVTPDVRIADEDGVANGDRAMDEAVRIAQSRQLKEMAAASGRCGTKNVPLRNSFKSDMFDAIQPKTVLR
ncbi:MAG: S41 family peptidase [Fuerstiella sp.]|nr:S41 family peptidase [Fuerstiella sp.]